MGLAFFDVLVIETALIVSPFNSPVTATWSVRNGRIWLGLPVTEYDLPALCRIY